MTAAPTATISSPSGSEVSISALIPLEEKGSDEQEVWLRLRATEARFLPSNDDLRREIAEALGLRDNQIVGPTTGTTSNGPLGIDDWHNVEVIIDTTSDLVTILGPVVAIVRGYLKDRFADEDWREDEAYK